MKIFNYTILGLFFLINVSSSPKEEWTNLLDKDLSHWRMYLSFPHVNGYAGEEKVNPKGEKVIPIGYDKNVNKVFTVIKENNVPVLRISGEIYGCVFTKKEYENYHLKLQYKWGSKKWIPRLNEDKDSGILYHSTGECGVDYWRSWMLSQEFQLIEKSTGDYWCIANSQIDIKALPIKGKDTFIYNTKGTKTTFGISSANGNFCQANGNYEKPGGEWNTVELICFGNKSLHIINGKVAMALSGSRYLEGKTAKPLTKGKIQLQSEAAEVFFKDIQIKSIKEIPQEYSVYF